MKAKIFKAARRTFKGGVLLIIVSCTALFFYMKSPKFGKAPSGKRLEAIQKAANYKKGQFQNLHPTPAITEGYSMGGVMYDFIFTKYPRKTPKVPVPSLKTDLKQLDISQDVIVWFGHSSYFMQLGGKRFLVDPVFSGSASPVPGSVKSFKGANIYTVEDLPAIDYLLISHDHYDHLDYATIKKLRDKVGQVVCGLGVGEHFEYWGYDPAVIREGNWNDMMMLDSNTILHITPARHFSGRSLRRNNTLWASYVLEVGGKKIYVGGDSGYDTHFREIGSQYGPFDIAILENGQYDVKWAYIHMQPEEVVQAAKDLQARLLFPVHSSKFALANHPWDEPLIRVSRAAKEAGVSLATPVIGEPIDLDNSGQAYREWWVGLEP